jgi:hypothetical protein
MSCKRVHHKKEDYDIYVGRPSKWGSPFSYKEGTLAKYKVNTRLESIEKHKEWLLYGEGQYLLEDIHELKGKVLGCWCDEKSRCHADILVELANNLDKKNLNEFFE